MKHQRGEAIVAILLLSTIIQVVPMVVKAYHPAELRCWLGFMHNGTTGMQLIDKTGGGIPCVPLEELKAVTEEAENVAAK